MLQTRLAFIFACILPLSQFAQKVTPPTDSIFVSGDIKEELVITLADLLRESAVPLDDITIKNHLGEPKKTLTGIKGVPLLKFLEKVEITAESPRDLSQYYFILIASDGYSVLYSWNELFNNPLGSEVYLLTQVDHVFADKMKDRIVCISTTDNNTGRRYVKGLRSIVIRKSGQ